MAAPRRRGGEGAGHERPSFGDLVSVVSELSRSPDEAAAVLGHLVASGRLRFVDTSRPATAHRPRGASSPASS